MNTDPVSLLDLNLESIESAAALIHRTLSPTAQITWPLLSERSGCELWVKHENHLPTGAFKVRGGLVYHDWLRRNHPEVKGVVAATRGNHGQSVAFAARAQGLSATIVIPHGNSPEKNRAMRAYGAELIEHGRDFNEALEFAGTAAQERGLHFVPSFDWKLVRGVATYGLEFFRGAPELDRIYVPIGLGSGICGILAARAALGRDATEIVGVVSERAPTYADSLKAGHSVPGTEIPDTVADGVACRIPNESALDAMIGKVSRILTVPEPSICAAMGYCFTDCHQIAEGAGAIPLAAALLDEERERNAGKRIGVILSGGNVDAEIYRKILESP
jgi:threonine dehydratase